MKIYDISQEVLSSVVFPGDPAPKAITLARIADGSNFNLSALDMCAHNGTHVDAPSHFIDGGKTIDALDLHTLVGHAYVAEHQGVVTAEDAVCILQKARCYESDCHLRILIKGKAEVSLEAARVFADAGVRLVGNESQTVGPENAPMAVHLELLGKDVILLEGIRLSHVPEGEYLLNAAPLNFAGIEGSPCRAILMEL